MLIILLSYDKGTLHFLHTRLICLVFFLLDANEGSVTSLVFAAPWSACLFGPVTSLHLPAVSSYLFLAHFVLLVHCLMKQPGQRRGTISRYDWSSQVSGKKTPTAGCTTCFYWAGRKRKVHAGLLGIRSVGQMAGLAWVQQKMTNSSTKINRSFVIKKNFVFFTVLHWTGAEKDVRVNDWRRCVCTTWLSQGLTHTWCIFFC